MKQCCHQRLSVTFLGKKGNLKKQYKKNTENNIDGEVHSIIWRGSSVMKETLHHFTCSYASSGPSSVSPEPARASTERLKDTGDEILVKFVLLVSSVGESFRSFQSIIR